MFACAKQPSGSYDHLVHNLSKSIVSAFLSLITQRAHRVASHVHQLEILICSIYKALIITNVDNQYKFTMTINK